jgi:hypothetical protein
MPNLMWAPSKAGPEAQDRLVIFPFASRHISVLVPMSNGAPASIGLLVPSIRFYGNEERLASELRRTCDIIRQRFGAN